MKTYTKPSVEAIELHIENDIALVIGSATGSGTVGGSNGGWTREGGWSSENWSEIEDEEDFE